MGFITEPAKDILGGVTGALSGKGPGGLDPSRVNTQAFTDPYRDANKALLEQQRQSQLAQAGQGQAGQKLAGQQQQMLIGQLQQRVAGQTPSIAELQMNRGLDANRQALASQAASQRGASSGLLARNLARTQAQAGQQTVADAALLRAQEQQAAEQSLAGVLGQTRTLDQASQQQANQLALQYMQLGLGVDQAQFLANQELEKVRTGQATAQAQIGAQQQAGILGAIGAGAGALALSDKNQKKNIEDGEKDVSSFLKAISAKKYDYKDASLPGTAEGKRYGIIAQDLEKSPMGKSLVKDTPNGKMIDVGQSVGALLASVSNLNKRLEKVGA